MTFDTPAAEGAERHPGAKKKTREEAIQTVAELLVFWTTEASEAERTA